jgi:ABC-2 type transport system ATP-binding protein
MIVDVHNLTVQYGELTAVDAFSFRAQEGEILAFVGPDGAGKTSLFRSLCGLIDFTADKTEIAGYAVASHFDRIKPLLGYMPQTFSLYPDLSVEENMRFYAGLFGLEGDAYRSRRERLYAFSGLEPFHRRRAAQLSGGMKQKLALSCALLHDPKVLILDEPTTGVDPVSRRQFWNILHTLRESGTAVIVSTPYMDEVARADRAVFMHRGGKLAEGTPAELTRLYAGEVFRLAVEPTTETMARLQAIEGIDARRFGAAVHLYAPEGTSVADVHRRLLAAGVAAEQMDALAPDLEDVFIQLMDR